MEGKEKQEDLNEREPHVKREKIYYHDSVHLLMLWLSQIFQGHATLVAIESLCTRLIGRLYNRKMFRVICLKCLRFKVFVSLDFVQWLTSVHALYVRVEWVVL